MENLTNEELQTELNKVRAIFINKKGNEKNTPKHLLPSLYKELQELSNRMNEIREEGVKRDIVLN
jgi:hypothetical protein